MLDTETKRRIDEARDILVGKLPDPKSQVEQITIALIYKFMYDMDKEALDFGGEATFFSGEWEKYSWTKIFDPKIGGHEMLNLYGEAIVKLNQNPNIPQLFRDIFKNAYLPYRDPETLKLFLKTINGFTYDHSERLGDAFEYLLSVLGSQGDAGQFRTPRHIIDFIVAVLQPKKNESICDPACGTAGFLISSYKYILQQNTKKNKGDLLTPDDKKKMMQRFVGYDISPDMVRLSLVNMYLHNFTTPKIYEYDTLTSEDRWNESFDIIMANPPFMSPKGGIKPHKKFTMQANRSEVLFVDYIAEHINPATGRAGVIVPEGIIFQSANAYKQLRQLLVDKKYLYAVVSLPAGIFQPYSGVKTSVLLMDRTLAKKTDNILFVKIENDGFDLGAQRRAIDKNDLTAGLIHLQEYKEAVLNNTEFTSDNKNAFVVDKKIIKGTGDYNLSVDRYRNIDSVITSVYEKIPLEQICEITSSKRIFQEEYVDSGIPFYRTKEIVELSKGKEISLELFISEEKYFEIKKKFDLPQKGDLLISAVGTIGVTWVIPDNREFYFKDGNLIWLKNLKETNPTFLKFILEKMVQEKLPELSNGAAYNALTIVNLKQLQIPLPPLSIQQQMVDKIESYQAIINGAKQVVQNYKPQIDIDPDWEMVELGDVCKINPETISPNEVYGNSEFIYLDISSVENGTGIYSLENLIKGNNAPSRARRKIKDNDVLLSTVRPNLKAYALLKSIPKNTIASTGFAVLRCKERLIPKFIYELLFTDFLQEQMISQMGKGAYPSINQSDVDSFKIPLPPLPIQQQIVNLIEQEQQLVNANKELIKIYEQKIKDEINKLWQPAAKEYVVEEEKLTVAAEG